jgi:hypothetical protein
MVLRQQLSRQDMGDVLSVPTFIWLLKLMEMFLQVQDRLLFAD